MAGGAAPFLFRFSSGAESPLEPPEPRLAVPGREPQHAISPSSASGAGAGAGAPNTPAASPLLHPRTDPVPPPEHTDPVPPPSAAACRLCTPSARSRPRFQAGCPFPCCCATRREMILDCPSPQLLRFLVLASTVTDTQFFAHPEDAIRKIENLNASPVILPVKICPPATPAVGSYRRSLKRFKLLKQEALPELPSGRGLPRAGVVGAQAARSGRRGPHWSLASGRSGAFVRG